MQKETTNKKLIKEKKVLRSMNEDKKLIAYCGLYCGDYVQIYFEKSINKNLNLL